LVTVDDAVRPAVRHDARLGNARPRTPEELWTGFAHLVLRGGFWELERGVVGAVWGSVRRLSGCPDGRGAVV
jgi:hypothetical protein